MVGTGNMGGRITRRMVEAGHDVLAVDAEPARIPACGAAPAKDVAELAGRCDVIMLSLPDSPVIESVIRSPAACSSTPATDRSSWTSAPRTRPPPAHCTPSSTDAACATWTPGSPAALRPPEKGTLTLMVGGDEAALAQVRPLARHVQRARAPHGRKRRRPRDKVLNNFLNGVTLAATAEVMVAGKKAGLDLARLLEVINTSSGVSFASLNRFPHIIKGDYLEGGLTGRLMAKDVRLYLDLAGDLGVVTLTGPGRLTAFEVSSALGYGDLISNRSRRRPRRPGRRRPRLGAGEGLTRMHISHGRSGQPSEQRTATFTGTVHLYRS